jgi:hypothetical protein
MSDGREAVLLEHLPRGKRRACKSLIRARKMSMRI